MRNPHSPQHSQHGLPEMLVWLTPGSGPTKSPSPLTPPSHTLRILPGTVPSLPPTSFIHFLTRLGSSGGPASRSHLLPSKRRGPRLPESSGLPLRVPSTQDAVPPSRYSGHTCRENKSTHAITQWRGTNSPCTPSLCADQSPEAADLPPREGRSCQMPLPEPALSSQARALLPRNANF